MIDLKGKEKTPLVSFDSPTNEVLENHLKIMKEAKNTESMMYKLCQLREDPPVTETEEELLPKWVQRLVFRPTVMPLLPGETRRKPLTEAQRIFYEKEIMHSLYEAYHVCSLTVEQGGCRLWHDKRDPITTSSNVSFKSPFHKYYIPLSQYFCFISSSKLKFRFKCTESLVA